MPKESATGDLMMDESDSWLLMRRRLLHERSQYSCSNKSPPIVSGGAGLLAKVDRCNAGHKTVVVA